MEYVGLTVGFEFEKVCGGVHWCGICVSDTSCLSCPANCRQDGFLLIFFRTRVSVNNCILLTWCL